MNYERELLERMLQNPRQSADDFQNIHRQIAESDLSFRGRCVQTLGVPKIFSADTYRHMTDFTTKCFALFHKVMERYFCDADYRKLFGFPAALEELILLSAGKPPFIPMARVDFFLQEDTEDITLCEINTDGASAMNEDRILGGLLSSHSAFQEYMTDKPHKRFELFDSWAAEFANMYQRMKNSDALPNVVIADFLEKATIHEFERFKESFISRGMQTEICDVRELSYTNGRLRTPSGMEVDAVYRRAVTADIMAEYDNTKPFIQAAKDGAVSLIGEFCTQIIHNKKIFLVLHHETTKSFLTAEEIAFVGNHVPLTLALSDENIRSGRALEDKDAWIIKPYDSYGSKGVYAGLNYSAEDWAALVNENTGSNYLMQRFTRPYKTPNIDYRKLSPSVRDYSNITGIFCYNEQPYGVYSRLAEGEIISSQYDEKTVATVLCGE